MPASRLPPGPSQSSLVQTIHFARDPAAYLDENRQRFGDSFTMRLMGQVPYIVLGSAEGVRDVLASPPDDFRAGEATRALEFLVGRHSLVRLDGARHTRERKLLMPSLHGERMAGYGERMRDIALATITRWPIGQTFPARRGFEPITLDAILECALGMPASPRRDRFRALMIRFLDTSMTPAALTVWSLLAGGPLHDFLGQRVAPIARRLGPLRRFLPGATLALAARELDDFIDEEIRLRRAAPPGDDVVSMLIAARDETGVGMSDAELHDEIMTMVVAGYETTASMLSWALSEILPREDVIIAIVRELDTVFGDDPAIPINPARVRDLVYLEAAIKETLRLNPIGAGFTRKLRRPARVAGHDLPAGVVVMPSMHLVHRNPEVWPDPHTFTPERFLQRKPKPYEWFPFGGGVRTCAGMAFSMYEMKIVLATLFRHVTVRLPAGAARDKLAVRGFLFVPSAGVPIEVTGRISQSPTATNTVVQSPPSATA